MYGVMPSAASQLLKDFGLAAFVAVVGLNSGLQAVVTVKQSGMTIFLLGVFVTLFPLLLTMVFGRYVLRYNNAALLAGALSGSRSANPAFGGVLDKARKRSADRAVCNHVRARERAADLARTACGRARLKAVLDFFSLRWRFQASFQTGRPRDSKEESIMAKKGSDKHGSEMAALSPFELKDELIKAAGGGAVERPANASMLNAGRGNPNFLATIPRHGFWQLGLFAMRESERSFAHMPEGLGGFPKREGLEERFEIFARDYKGTPGIDFLRGALSYVRDQLGLNGGEFLYEMCEGILASNYPVPDRMLKLSEIIVGQYLRREMIGRHPFIGEFDIFATEGGTAAMTYIFNTLRENHLIARATRSHSARRSSRRTSRSAPERLSAQCGRSQCGRGEGMAVLQTGTRQVARPQGQGLFPGEPEQSSFGEDGYGESQLHCGDREGASRPDPADRRRVRHFRRRFCLAVRVVARRTRFSCTPTQNILVPRDGGSGRLPCIATT